VDGEADFRVHLAVKGQHAQQAARLAEEELICVSFRPGAGLFQIQRQIEPLMPVAEIREVPGLVAHAPLDTRCALVSGKSTRPVPSSLASSVWNTLRRPAANPYADPDMNNLRILRGSRAKARGVKVPGT